MLLMPENSSSNIFTQSASQFQVLESVPNLIQQLVPNADQPNTSPIASAAIVENADQIMDAPNADPVALAPEVSTVNDTHPATSLLPDLPQTADHIPILPHASTSTNTNTSTSTSASANANANASASTGPHPTSFPFDQATVKAMNEKKYHYKTKMRPGISITAR
jgi:hypothetical protein